MDKSLVLVLGLVLYFSSITDAYPVPKKQYLPYRPGYVPVYIRNGDTPLEEINLDLAEAFHSIPSGRSAGRLNDIKAARSQEKHEENGGYNIVVKVETPTIVELATPRKEKSKVTKEETHLDKVEISSESEDVKVKEDNTKPKASFTQSDKKKVIPQKEQNSKFIQKIPKE